MPPTSSTIKYQVRDRIAWVTLNRPEALNALNSEIRNAIAEAFREAASDDEVLVVILSGEGGRAFCAGADLKEMSQRDASGEASSRGLPGWEREVVAECLKPVIAAIDGYCLAGGLQLANRCDIRIATEQSRFGMPEVRRSLAAVGLMDTPEQMMPIGEALWILLTGSHMTAKRAYDIGLVQALVPDREALFAEAEQVAAEIKQCAPLAVQAAKQVIKVWRELPTPPELSRKLSAPWLDRVTNSEDRLEGPRAFAEKRAPMWKMR